MASQIDSLKGWIVSALQHYMGQAHHIDVAKWIWQNKRDELYEMGDMFYIWQYKIRWAATSLRQDKVLLPADECASGTWALRS